MKNKLLWFCRIFVGILFIFSGLVKANDPVGFGIKLDEYFEVFADTWKWSAFLFKSEWLLNTTTWQAAFLTTLEVALGIALLLGIRKNLVAWLLLLLILFFTWLTGFTAVTGTPTDCGCFGDAIPLTALQSFYKDLVLTALILVIFFMRKQIKPLFGPAANIIVFILVTGFAVWVNMRVIRHDVFIDFRPYAKGKNIAEQMMIPDSAQKALIEMNYIYENKQTKERATATILSNQPDYSKLNKYSDTTTWKFIDRVDETIEKGFIPEISDFSIVDETGSNITDKILGDKDYQLMIVAHDFDGTNPDGWKLINEMQHDAEKEGIFTFAMVGEGSKEIDIFRHANQTAFPFYPSDSKVCITIARVNPSVILLKEGTVVDKWSWRDLPSFGEIKAQYFPERAPTQLKAKTDELFPVGDDVVTLLKNSTEPYNEFFLQDAQGNDVTQAVINDSLPIYILIVNELGKEKLTMEKWTDVKAMMGQLAEVHANYFVVSSGVVEVLDAMRTASGYSYSYFISDKDVLLKIIKENAGLIVINKGIVVNKFTESAWPANHSFLIN